MAGLFESWGNFSFVGDANFDSGIVELPSLISGAGATYESLNIAADVTAVTGGSWTIKLLFAVNRNNPPAAQTLGVRQLAGITTTGVKVLGLQSFTTALSVHPRPTHYQIIKDATVGPHQLDFSLWAARSKGSPGLQSVTQIPSTTLAPGVEIFFALPFKLVAYRRGVIIVDAKAASGNTFVRWYESPMGNTPAFQYAVATVNSVGLFIAQPLTTAVGNNPGLHFADLIGTSTDGFGSTFTVDVYLLGGGD